MTRKSERSFVNPRKAIAATGMDEVNVNVFDDGIAAQMEAMFHEDLKRCEEMTLRKWFRRGWLDKLKEKMAEVFRPQL